MAAPRLSLAGVPDDSTLAPRYWRRSEQMVLRVLYPIGGAQLVASCLSGRSVDTIYARAAALGLQAPPRGWLRAEIEILQTTYPTGGAKACARMLPGRSLRSIVDQAQERGIRRRRGVAA
jgi:hypothetical protein